MDRINFSGNQAIDDETLRGIIKAPQGKRITFDELKALALQITQYYHDCGYFLARAIIPKQNFYDGTVEIYILEGQLGEIIVSYVTPSACLARRFSKRYIHKAFFKLEPDRAIRKRDLESSLVRLNDLSGIEASSILRVGKKTGTTDVVVEVTDQEKLKGLISINNFGTENTDRCRIASKFDIQNVSGFGDLLKLNVTSAPDPSDLLYGRLEYIRPIGSRGNKFHVYVSDGGSEVGGIFSALGIKNRGTAWGIGISHPAYVSLTRKTVYNAFFDFDDTEYEILGLLSAKDKIRKLRLGVDVDSKGSDWHNFLSFNIQRGLGKNLDGMINNSPLSSRSLSKADNSFTKITGDYTHVKKLSPRTTLVARGRGQYSIDPLVAKEQWSIGGINSVRGYESGICLGDSGFTVNLESYFSLDNEGSFQTQLVLFADGAMVSTKVPVPGQGKYDTLTGAGIGLRINFPYDTKFQFDLGFPMESDAIDDFVPYAQLSKEF